MEAFIFDMDGVLIDSETVHSRVKLDTFARFGIPFQPEELPRYMGRTSKAIFTDVLAKNPRDGVSVETLTKYKHDRYLEVIQEEGGIIPIEGAAELARKIQAAGYKMGLASSSWRPVIELVLKRLDLEEIFDAVMSGTDVKDSKPNPEIYLVTAKMLGAAPENCCVLEDTAAGVAAAKNAGMKAIGFISPNSGKQDLSAADEIAAEMADVLKILKIE